MAERAGDPASGVLGVPWPHPGAGALLQVGDDFVGDPAVNVRAVGGGVGFGFVVFL